jgi:hypothetical protein
MFDLQSSPEQEALAALIARAAKSIKTPKFFVSLDDLRERWDTYRATHADPSRTVLLPSEEQQKTWEERQRAALDAALVKMRMRRMLFQGYPWTCEACGHRNWVDFQALRPALACEVCLSEKDLPVGVPWYFRANEFLVESLRSHSVLSLIWILSALQHRAMSSFLYVGPTKFGDAGNYDRATVEADLLVVVDGEAILCEVKSAWVGVRAAHVQGLVRLAKQLRPDRALLAVMENGSKQEAEIQRAREELEAAGIAFELLTPQAYRVPDDLILV